MWNQWSGMPGVPAAPPPQPSVPPPLPDAPPPPPPSESAPPPVAVSAPAGSAVGAVAPSASAYMTATPSAMPTMTNPYEQYTAAQYAAMTPEQQYAMQQHWHQWQTYQQEYAKWHAQYGEQYKREMAAAAAATGTPPVTTAVAPTVAAYPQPQPQPAIQPMQPAPTQSQPFFAPTIPIQQPSAKIMAQPQMYNQPPPPPPVQQQQPPPYQQQPGGPWTQQPPSGGRYNQTIGNFSQPPPMGNSTNESVHPPFPNLQQPPPFMGTKMSAPPQQMPSNQTKPWAQPPPDNKSFNKGGNKSFNDQHSRWEGPVDDNSTNSGGNQLNTNSNNNNQRPRWQTNDPDTNMGVGPNQQGNNNRGGNKQGNRQSWGGRSNNAPGNTGGNDGPNNNDPKNPFSRFENDGSRDFDSSSSYGKSGNFGSPGDRSGSNSFGNSRGGNSGNFGGPGGGNSDNFGGPVGVNSGNFGGPGAGTPSNFGSSGGNSGNFRGPGGGNTGNFGGPGGDNSGNFGSSGPRNSGGFGNDGPGNFGRSGAPRNSSNFGNNSCSGPGNFGNNELGPNNFINNGTPGNSGNFGNNNSNNFGPGGFGNNRRSGGGRWENRPNQNFGPNNSEGDSGGFNRGGQNQRNFGQQQQQSQQRGPDLDEESFDRLFDQWEKQFEDWKRANANHPDRDEYRRYEEEFEKQRRRIAERREQMRRRRQMQNPQQQSISTNSNDFTPNDGKFGQQMSDQEELSEQQQRNPTDVIIGPQLPGSAIEVDESNPLNNTKTHQRQDHSQPNPPQKHSQQDDNQNAMPTRIQLQNFNKTSQMPVTEPLAPQKQEQQINLLPHQQQSGQSASATIPSSSASPKKDHDVKSQPQRTTPINRREQQQKQQGKEEVKESTKAGEIGLGKRKSDGPNTTTAPAKQNKQDNILIISLDDDDDDEVVAAATDCTDTPMKNIFKKSDGIPGLDLVGVGGKEGDSNKQTKDTDLSPAKSNSEQKKIPSLFDVVISKPDSSPSNASKEKSKPPLDPKELHEQLKSSNISSLPETVTNALQDPEFMSKMTQVLAKAQGRDIPEPEKPSENQGNDGRPMSFAEWQRMKKMDGFNPDSSCPGGPSNGSGMGSGMGLGGPSGNLGMGPRGPGMGPGGPSCGPGMGPGGPGMGPGGPGMGPGGPGMGPGGPRGGPVIGPRAPGGGPSMGLGGPGSGPGMGPGGPGGGPGMGPTNGPPGFNPAGANFGPGFNGPPGFNPHGQHFGNAGPDRFGPNGPQFGPGPGPNAGPNFMDFDPNNQSLGPNGPNFNDRRNSFGPNFRGNGPPGPGQFGPNFPGPNGSGQGSNFGFGGPGPNFGRNFGGPNNSNFPGPNNNSFGDNNPFRRNAGPPAPMFDDDARGGGGNGPSPNMGSGSRANNQKNFGPPRNSFGNGNKIWSDGADNANVIPNGPEDSIYRPMQVFDYQNSNTAPQVFEYGHKSADSGDFRPVKTFDYGHASRNMPVGGGLGGGGAAAASAAGGDRGHAGPGIMNRNPNKKRNKKRNKKNQQRMQQQQPNPQQQQNSQDQAQRQQNSQDPDHQQHNLQDQQSETTSESNARAPSIEDELEDISDGEDNLVDNGLQQDTPPPPPSVSWQKPNQQQQTKAFPANPQRRILTQPSTSTPTAIFPSTAAANTQIPSNQNACHLEMSIPTNENRNTISIDEVLLKPGRMSRPKRICVILRGPPGSGKSHVAKLIKEKELEMGGPNPRILSIDDYFIIENDYEEKCPKTGKKIPKKEILYEYDDTMEETYMQYLIKSFKKTLSDNLYDFIIVDCNNNSLRTLNEFYCNAKDSNFVPYIVDMHCDLETCLSRNIHDRSERDIRAVLDNWCTTPFHYIKLDVGSLLENVIEMEDVENMATDDNAINEDDPENSSQDAVDATDAAEEDNSNSADASNVCGFLKSKWESDTTEENLARLDGTNRLKRKTASMADYLQLDDWEPPIRTADGKKRVRWADIEERRAQQKMRAIGFVVGQTDWKRMMDPNAGNRALNRTKYIERVNKRR
ncbi:trithorax group protein osa isoform X1 [Scaptodrosophila lebanonensis]|uniref:YLP motif-containing protein 1 n=1 Tax=Drosophila lebanonensis TaxID=7225 RepID=A0A6J2U1X9_DROLE|nr:trithorax group protein osa isoform X1 [Scaptodrosophila lebanonensis]